MKKIVKEEEKESKTREENMHRLDTTVTLSWKNFTDEFITQEIFAESKVFQIGDIVENLRKKVAELELQVTPSTPLEVPKERIKETIKAAKRI